jgi:hypothetical protein
LNRRVSAIALIHLLAGEADDEFEFFVQTAQALLAMAGRNECAVSLALLEKPGRICTPDETSSGGYALGVVPTNRTSRAGL